MSQIPAARSTVTPLSVASTGSRDGSVLNGCLIAFSLTEVQVLYELAHRDELPLRGRRAGARSGIPEPPARRLSAVACSRTPSSADARQRHLHLTPAAGRAALPDRRAHDDGRDAAADAGRVADVATAAPREIESLLPPARGSPIAGAPRPGDLGWVVQRHGASMQPSSVRRDVRSAGRADRRRLRPRLRCKRRLLLDRRARRSPRRVDLPGSQVEDDGKLRLFCRSRGTRHGLGTRLIDECIHFARGPVTGQSPCGPSRSCWRQAPVSAGRLQADCDRTTPQLRPDSWREWEPGCDHRAARPRGHARCRSPIGDESGSRCR